jgi:hypothetical protein
MIASATDLADSNAARAVSSQRSTLSPCVARLLSYAQRANRCGFIQMYTNLDNFVAAAEQLRTLRASNLVRFHVSSQGQVTLAFDPAAAQNAPPPGGGLYMDLQDAIAAVGAGVTIEEFQRGRSEPRPGFTEPESPDIAAAKYQQVAVFGEELRPRVLLRATSRAPILVAHDWEVVTKQVDSARNDDAFKVSSGLMRITFERALAVNMGVKQEAVTLGLDLQDIDELIEDLEKLRLALARFPTERVEDDGGAGGEEDLG